MFNNIIYISMRPHVAQTRGGEVEEEFRRGLSQRIERDVRNRIDPGVTFRGYQRAQGVKVTLGKDPGQLSLKSNEPGKAELKPDQKGNEGKPVLDREDTINDLFTPSSGVPLVVTGPDGETRFAFRTVRDTEMFGRDQEQQDTEIKRIVDNAVQNGIVDEMDEGMTTVERRYPSEAIGSEEIQGVE